MPKKDPFVPFISDVRNSRISQNATFSFGDDFMISSDQLTADNSMTADFLGLSISQKRILLFFIFIFLTLFVLLFRAFQLQIVRGEYYDAVARENRIRIRSIPAVRGTVFDRNKRQLVYNIPSFALYLHVYDFRENEDALDTIVSDVYPIIEKNSIYGQTLDELMAVIQEQIALSEKNPYRTLVLADNLTDEQVILIKLQVLKKYKGFELIATSQRQYVMDPQDSSFNSSSHILGYMGRITQDVLDGDPSYEMTDTVGKTGIEFQYESLLRGEKGKETVEVNALGQKLKTLAQELPNAGSDLVLTLDIALQEKVESVMKERFSEYHKKSGSVVVMDPNTGEVLAMVSLPSFDNNLFSKGIGYQQFQTLLNDPKRPLLNRALQGTYPPGSTFKTIIASAALQENIVTPRTTFLSSGGLRIGQWFFPDWRAGGHGRTDLSWALADSVNTYFYLVGGGDQSDFVGLGVQRIKDYAELFGLNAPLGIDLPGERGGFLPDKAWKEEAKGERWYIGDTYHLAIGQGDVLVTPLQMASVISTIANGGTLYQPHLLKAYMQETEKVVTEPNIIRSGFIDPSNIAAVTAGLRAAVTKGSARFLSTLPVRAAGKTGTAQWNTTAPPHAWFIGYAPFEKPQIAISVMVEEGEEGSAIGVRIASDILGWYFGEHADLLTK